jgi:hypothetical protein
MAAAKAQLTVKASPRTPRPLETPDELADHLADLLADLLGIYGAHGEQCTDRGCWVPGMAERILRSSVLNEQRLVGHPADIRHRDFYSSTKQFGGCRER